MEGKKGEGSGREGREGSGRGGKGEGREIPHRMNVTD